MTQVATPKNESVPTLPHSKPPTWPVEVQYAHTAVADGIHDPKWTRIAWIGDMQSQFCAAVDPTPRLAVLGIFSLAQNLELRQALRGTWMDSNAAILQRFVLRGEGGSPDVLRERVQHNDLILLQAADGLNRTEGPLVSLMRWMECAASAWPAATLIGKADNDVHVDLSGVVSYLIRSLQFARKTTPGSVPPLLLWGVMETFSWYRPTQKPVKFMRGYGFGEDCRFIGPNYTVVDGDSGRLELTGPFSFPKGPIFFLSYDLVGQLLASSKLRGDVMLTLQEAQRPSPGPQYRSIPFEDVFLGMALATVAMGQGLIAMHAGLNIYTERKNRTNSDNVLISHRLKSAVRIREEHARALQRNSCFVPPTRYDCAAWKSCSGATWRRCAPHNKTVCVGTRV